MRKVWWGTIGLVVITAAAAGCSDLNSGASPSPTATKTVVADEALQGREALLRYVSAAAGVDLGDPSTFEPVFEATSGDLRASEEKALGEFHDAGWSRSGRVEVTYVSAEDENPAPDAVSFIACIDSSGVVYRDADDKVRTPENGGKLMGFKVEAALSAESDWTISGLSEWKSEPRCA